ncbi:MAG: beta-lactamase family protein [Phycisphaerales bacterium]|nr:beta-lactamase family protein [Phycisphaerales bacterium]
MRASRALLCGLWVTCGGLFMAQADTPVTGMPVPELALFDNLMVQFMEDNDIHSGLLAVMRDGVIVYQRGFGWKDADKTIPLRHDAVARIASITKPFTAAAIQRLYSTGHLDPDDIVFNLGQPGGGLLSYAAFDGNGLVQFPNIPDSRMQDITVQQILSHTSGLPSNAVADPMFQEITIANAFNDADLPTGNPPGRTRHTQWVLGLTLASDPGGTVAYSNFGFMVLGQVIEAVSGTNHLTYVRNNVLGGIAWLPITEVVAGRTFEVELDPREPYYANTQMATNVFDPNGPQVRRAHGGYHHELHFASGAFATSTTALLHLAENYYVQAENFGGGSALTYGALTNGVRSTRSHGGLLWGTDTSLRQRSDGVNFAVIFNAGGPGTNFGGQMRDLLDGVLDGGGFTWPDQGVDGQWVDFSAGMGDGSYEFPWADLGVALGSSPAKATLNLRASVSDWTGVINQRVRLRNPQNGVARIGQQ